MVIFCWFLQLKCVVACVYVAWPFAIGFTTKMCNHIWQITKKFTHGKKDSIGFG